MSFVAGLTGELRDWLNTIFKKNTATRREELLQEVLAGAAALGLPQRDIQNAQAMLDYDEYEIGFDIIIVKLFEFEIEITEKYFLLLEQTANRLQVPAVEYIFVKELVRASNHVPKPVREKLSLLLKLLQKR